MRRKKSLLIPAVLAFSLCTGAVVPVLAEETSQTADTARQMQIINKRHQRAALMALHRRQPILLTAFRIPLKLPLISRTVPRVPQILLIPLMKKAPSQTLIFRVSG